MAVETKIGLVVGLGFITCFAVVLSHRGSGDQLSARMAYDVLSKQNVTATPEPITPPETYTRRQARERQASDGGSKRRKDARKFQSKRNRSSATGKRNAGARRSSKTSSGVGNKKITRSPGRQHGKDMSARRNPTGKPTSRGQAGATKTRVRDASVSNESKRTRNSGNRARQSEKGLPSFEALFGGTAANRDGVEKNAKRQADLQVARNAKARRQRINLKKPTGNGGVDRRSLNRAITSRKKVASGAGKVSDVARKPNAAKKTTTERKARTQSPVKDVSIDRKKTPKTPKTPTRYVVKPKDTLWGISERMYGAGSRKIVNAILAANKDRLTSAERLRAGVDLVLPSIDGVGAAKLVAKPRAERTSKLASAPERPRYYQIQNGDRYSTIAERFLGSKSRWKEIHEMNKDIFPDPGKIRYGVRIRLPSSALLVSAS